MLSVGKALKHLHELHIAHGDITEENIIIFK